MHNIAQLCPRETGIFASKPGFWRMHQVIGHDGTCRQLDCWRVEVYWRRNHKLLDVFTKSNPSFEDLQEIDKHLAQEYIANHKLTWMC